MSLEEKETRVLALTLTLSSEALAKEGSVFSPPSPKLRWAMYPERDLNPHNRYGHRILSPACLPFHHPGGI